MLSPSGLVFPSFKSFPSYPINLLSCPIKPPKFGPFLWSAYIITVRTRICTLLSHDGFCTVPFSPQSVPLPPFMLVPLRMTLTCTGNRVPNFIVPVLSCSPVGFPCCDRWRSPCGPGPLGVHGGRVSAFSVSTYHDGSVESPEDEKFPVSPFQGSIPVSCSVWSTSSDCSPCSAGSSIACLPCPGGGGPSPSQSIM